MTLKATMFTLIVASLALTACRAGGPSTTIDVTMTDFQFTPNSLSVPAGQEITLNAINSGVVEHDFVIFKLGADAGDEFDEEDAGNVYWMVKLAPGQSLTVTFTAPLEPGEYFITCGVAGHLMAGMVGTLTVVVADE
jgi:uncharacterized cupredoxin-like copper-binding protein